MDNRKYLCYRKRHRDDNSIIQAKNSNFKWSFAILFYRLPLNSWCFRFIVLACSAKSFAVAIIFYFFVFSPGNLEGLGNFFIFVKLDASDLIRKHWKNFRINSVNWYSGKVWSVLIFRWVQNCKLFSKVLQ